MISLLETRTVSEYYESESSNTSNSVPNDYKNLHFCFPCRAIPRMPIHEPSIRIMRRRRERRKYFFGLICNSSENRPLVYDSDAIKPFDYCTLCLHHATNPMCWYVSIRSVNSFYSEEGHLFCNDCILQYLVTKMKEYEELMENYEVAMAELEV